MWQPHEGPQTDFLECGALDVCYGGARGGGKTDACLGEFGIHQAIYGPTAVGVFFREEYRQLGETVERGKQIFADMAQWVGGEASEFRFKSGARLKFRDLRNEEAAGKYQGHAYSRLYFEELTNWHSPAPIDRVTASVRSAAGVPVAFRSTCNPGGPGHSWVKARYIDPAPRGYKLLDIPGGQRVFIPAKLSDNPTLNRNDPMYAERLKLAGSEALVRAWLDGDWNQVEGAFFDCWNAAMIVKPVELPASWSRFMALDWGSAKPFSVGWWAISDGELPQFPRGALVRYREWYGCKDGQPNVGLKLTADELADGIKKMSGDEKLGVGVADPAIFIESGGPSIGEMMRRRGVSFRGADNKRVPGWEQLRGRMRGIDGKPMIYCFSTCAHSIRTIPSLPHDRSKAEDIDTDAEDHAADEWRYAVMSRPWTPAGKTQDTKRDRWDRAFQREDGQSWKTA